MHEKKSLSLLLVLFCLIAYWNSLSGSFIADDLTGISGNPSLTRTWSLWNDPSGFLASLNYLAGGYNPFLYHLTNIILHSLNTVLAFFFLMLFFDKEAAFFGAFIFALHPIHTEAVSWISGRPYLIMFSFIIGNLLIYNSRRYLLSFLIFLYTIINYQSFHHCLFPLLLVLFELSRGTLKKNWKLLLPFFLAVSVKLIWGRDVILHQASIVRQVTESPILDNFAYAAHSFYSHLRLLVWPHELTILHEGELISKVALTHGLILLIPPILLLALFFRKAKPLFLGLGIFMLFLSPTFSPIPISSLITERYLYIPSIGLSLALAYIYQKGVKAIPGARKYLAFFFITAGLISLILTLQRNEELNSPERLWSATLKSSPRSWQAHSNMGFIYLSKGRIQEAIAEYKEALALNSRSADAHNNLGVAYYRSGEKKKAEESFRKALELDPGLKSARRNLDNINSLK